MQLIQESMNRSIYWLGPPGDPFNPGGAPSLPDPDADPELGTPDLDEISDPRSNPDEPFNPLDGLGSINQF